MKGKIMATATEPKKKVRKVKLTDNPKQNVKTFACARLNNAVRNIGVFGNCFGDKYFWTEDQIGVAEESLLAAVEQAITNIRSGKKVTSAGIIL
jgi:hypothetical protein